MPKRLRSHALSCSRTRQVDRLLRELQEVDKLFEELLTYVAFDEFDQDRPELKMESIPVFETVKEIADEFVDTNEGLAINVGGDLDAAVIANPKLFARATSNLLLYAVAYGASHPS